MVVGAKEHIMNQGDVISMPSGDIHSFIGIGNALILEVSSPCLIDDNKFQNIEIAKWLKNNL